MTVYVLLLYFLFKARGQKPNQETNVHNVQAAHSDSKQK